MMKKRIRQWAALCAAVGIVGSAVMGCGSSAPKPDAGSGQTSREVCPLPASGFGADEPHPITALPTMPTAAHNAAHCLILFFIIFPSVLYLFYYSVYMLLNLFNKLSKM